MRKKEKLEKAMVKMLGDSAEGVILRDEIYQREFRREEIKGKMKSFFGLCVIGLALMLAISTVLAAIFCPVVFYSETEILFTVQNVSDTQYTYILSGNSSMRLRYYGETRNLDNSDIAFHIMVAHCWNHIEKAEIWAAQGNISYLDVKEYD
jgi:hypothetical protein